MNVAGPEAPCAGVNVQAPAAVQTAVPELGVPTDTTVRVCPASPSVSLSSTRTTTGVWNGVVRSSSRASGTRFVTVTTTVVTPVLPPWSVTKTSTG